MPHDAWCMKITTDSKRKKDFRLLKNLENMIYFSSRQTLDLSQFWGGNLSLGEGLWEDFVKDEISSEGKYLA